MLSKLRLTSLLVVFAFVAGLAGTASATVHPLGGNGRFQIGDGLPIPATFAPAPTGRLLPVTGAVVSQTGTDPMAIKFPNAAMKAAVVPVNVPVAITNPAVFQVKTSIGITYPYSVGGADQTVSAGGRTGAAVVSYCPGQAVTPTGNPACASGAAAPHPNVKGILTYTATGAQFGGAMAGRVFGGADVALVGASAAPCTGCLAIMALASPNTTGTGGVGNQFGGMGTSPGAAPSSGYLIVTATAAGAITNATPTPSLMAGLTNAATTFGGPWTTGMLTVTAPFALGAAEVFTLTGSDARVSGVGSISLVSGSLSNRAISGPNANRGWLNLSMGGPLGALPSMSGPGIAALVGLMSLAGGYAMRQRRK
jgi:hypothetical protein